jgi:anti-sigma factor RsiW
MFAMFRRLRMLYYCRARMAAYVSGGLTAAERGRIARWIDADDGVYALYVRARDTRRALEQDIPALGLPEKPALDRMWAAIHAEILPGAAPRPSLALQRVRMGFVGAAVGLLLVMPISLGRHQAAPARLQQPAPLISQATAAAAVTDPPAGVAAVQRALDDETAAPQSIATLLPETAALVTRVTPTPDLE